MNFKFSCLKTMTKKRTLSVLEPNQTYQSNQSNPSKRVKLLLPKDSKLNPNVVAGLEELCNGFSETVDTIIKASEICENTSGTYIDSEHLKQFKKKYHSDKRNKDVQSAISNLPVSYVAENRDVLKNTNYVYSNVMPKNPTVANQASSGRCWLFSTLNLIRQSMMNSMTLPQTFELSEAFSFFYDKLERVNFILDDVIEMGTIDVNDPLFLFMLSPAGLLSDGGTWEFSCNILNKYGIVPKTVYGECFNTLDTDEMNSVLLEKTNSFVCELRNVHGRDKNSKKHKDKLRKLKDEKMMPEIYKLLANFMGEPPSNDKPFTWQYYATEKLGEYNSDENKFTRVTDLTPKSFYETYVTPYVDINNYITAIHDPRKHSKPYHTYTVSHFSNVSKMPDSGLVNLPLDVIKDATATSIKEASPCWFSCDVGKCFNYYENLLDDKAVNLERALNTTFPMSKADSLTYRTVAPTHAMLLVGVDINEDGKYNKWRIENSWGENGDVTNDAGYLNMSDSWFDKYVFEVVINKDHLPDEVTKKILSYADKPIELPFTDPFGAVAKLKK